MALSSKPSMMRISTAAGSGVLKDQEVVGSLSFGRLSYENAERTWAINIYLGPAGGGERFSVWFVIFNSGIRIIHGPWKMKRLGFQLEWKMKTSISTVAGNGLDVEPRQKLGQLLRTFLVV